MKTLVKIIFSLLIAAGILWLLEKAFRFGLYHNRNYKISYIQKHQINADLLIQGPCQGEYTIDPLVIEKYVGLKGYNLALAHASFADNYIYLVKYINTQKKPKVVLLYVTPDSFAENGTNTFLAYQFAAFIKDAEVKSVVEDFDRSFLKVSNIPFLSYSYYSNFVFYKALAGWKDYLTGQNESLWPTGYNAPVHEYTSYKHYTELSPKDGVFIWSKQMEKYFLKIDSLLKDKGIELVVYESPIYYQSMQSQKNRNNFLKRIDSLCLNNNIPFIRFDTLSLSKNRRYFFNSYNTTLEGNAIFNPIFGQMLRDTLPTIFAKQSNKQVK